MSRITRDICDWLDVRSRQRGRPAELTTFEPTHPVAPHETGNHQTMHAVEALSDLQPVQTRKLILAGGSGFLGGLLTSYFRKRGWAIVILTRAKAGQVSHLSGQRERLKTHAPNGLAENSTASTCLMTSPKQVGNLSYVGWDGLTIGKWATALEGADAVINLAGRSVNCRYHVRNRQLMMDSRVNSTRVIGEAIRNCQKPPTVWLNLSTATIYKHTFGDAWDETGEIGAHPAAKDRFSIEVAKAWERTFADARVPNTRKVALRSAMVFGLSNDANNVYRLLRRLVRSGLGGRMGSGRQWVSWIHERDFCRAIEFLIARDGIEGPVNLAAPNPVQNADMMRALRQILRMPVGLPATARLLELGAFLLRTETELIIKSRRVVPGRLLKAGFQFEFEYMQPALRDLERRWRSN